MSSKLFKEKQKKFFNVTVLQNFEKVYEYHGSGTTIQLGIIESMFSMFVQHVCFLGS